MEIYLFNPEHDMALASFSPYYKAPTEIIRMRNDLSALPVWYASKGACVWIESAEYKDLFESQCVHDELFPYGIICEKVNEENAVIPWGWDPALVSHLKKQEVDEVLLPDEEQLNQIRILSGRQQCVKVLQNFKAWSGVCGTAQICCSLEEVKDFLHSHTDIILKAPWSGSGRGLTRTSQSTWTQNLEGWTSRILRTQGTIMAEPIYNKVIDFAMEFYMHREGELSFAGYSFFETDSHGNYKANALLSNDQIVERLTHYVPKERLEKVKQQLLLSLSALLAKKYAGYFGVDMMICSEHENYVIHPCVEINLRMNMGVVARLLYDRYMSVGSEGSYIVEHYSTDGEAVEHDQLMRKQYPAVVHDRRMVKGYFALTPVTETTRYQCYIICNNE